MTPEQFKEIKDLILSYGSIQFWKGSYVDERQCECYKRASKRSDEILNELFSKLEDV